MQHEADVAIFWHMQALEAGAFVSLGSTPSLQVAYTCFHSALCHEMLKCCCICAISLVSTCRHCMAQPARAKGAGSSASCQAGRRRH